MVLITPSRRVLQFLNTTKSVLACQAVAYRGDSAQPSGVPSHPSKCRLSSTPQVAHTAGADTGANGAPQVQRPDRTVSALAFQGMPQRPHVTVGTTGIWEAVEDESSAAARIVCVLCMS
jgi:hypothetical protein